MQVCRVATLCWKPCQHPLRRFRPVNSIETREGGEVVVSFDDNLATVFMKSAALSSGPEKDGFTFDRVFPIETKQAEIFEYGVKECVVLKP